MSLKKVGEVKADKGFKIWDLVIYGVIILLTAALFIVVFLTRDDSPLKGIKIYVGNEVVFDYNFEEGKYTSSESAEVISETEEELTVKITTGGNGYNTVMIKKEGSVKVTEANCRTKDCVYTAEIENNGGAIYCRSHGLKIIPYGYDSDDGNLNM